MTWLNEEYFPGGGYSCPPLSAVATNGDIFRFTQNETISKDDFVAYTSKDRFRAKHKNNPEMLCQGSGLSSFVSENDAESFRKNVIKGAKATKKNFRYLSRVNLNENDGLILCTPSVNSCKHHTWWVRSGTIESNIKSSIIIKEY